MCDVTPEMDSRLCGEGRRGFDKGLEIPALEFDPHLFASAVLRSSNNVLFVILIVFISI